MGDKVRLGIIGMSDGNGHPYSWSAIFNGFDRDQMAKCPFPAIPGYLFQQNYPEDFLANAEVTHIWTQSREISEDIARASCIKHVVSDYIEMIGAVDAVILARDDTESHLKIAEPFLKAGMPIYIDKPFAHSVKHAEHLLSLQTYPGQIFTCSALRFANELKLSESDRKALGKITEIEAVTPSSWEKYAVHIIEPVLATCGFSVTDFTTERTKDQGMNKLKLTMGDGTILNFTSTGNIAHPIEMTYTGDTEIKLVFMDSFNCFKRALNEFVGSVKSKEQVIDNADTLAIISIIEAGLK